DLDPAWHTDRDCDRPCALGNDLDLQPCLDQLSFVEWKLQRLDRVKAVGIVDVQAAPVAPLPDAFRHPDTAGPVDVVRKRSAPSFLKHTQAANWIAKEECL